MPGAVEDCIISVRRLERIVATIPRSSSGDTPGVVGGPYPAAAGCGTVTAGE